MFHFFLKRNKLLRKSIELENNDQKNLKLAILYLTDSEGIHTEKQKPPKNFETTSIKWDF